MSVRRTHGKFAVNGMAGEGACVLTLSGTIPCISVLADTIADQSGPRAASEVGANFISKGLADASNLTVDTVPLLHGPRNGTLLRIQLSCRIGLILRHQDPVSGSVEWT